MASSVHSSILVDHDNQHNDIEATATPRGDILKNFDAYNDRMLQQSIEEAGIWTQNCAMVELWVWNDESSHLHLKGSWLDPILHKEYCCGSNSCPMCMLKDATADEFVPGVPVAPGEGLPGLLWSDHHSYGATEHHHHHNWFWSPRARTRYDVSSSHHTGVSLTSVATSITSATPVHRRHLQWRELQAIAHDPHQPWNPRLLTIANIPDANYVTAVPFRVQDASGIVMFVCRGESLTFATEHNESYMISAGQLIGTSYAIRRPWLTVVKEKRVEIKHALERLKTHFGGNNCLESIVSGDEGSDGGDSLDWKQVSLCRLVLSDVGQRVGQAMTKAKGAGMHPPPAMPWNESFLTFVGVFWTLLILTKFNHGIVAWLGSEYEIVLGPFGAFVTLLYCLSSAPAAQPRNAILGQTVSLVISILISQIGFLTIWMKQSLSTALAVAAMAKIGVVHPPAGASAMIFASGGHYSWTNLATLIVGNFLAIFTATLMNNFSVKRQYPSYWGFPDFRMCGRPREEAS